MDVMFEGKRYSLGGSGLSEEEVNAAIAAKLSGYSTAEEVDKKIDEKLSSVEALLRTV